MSAFEPAETWMTAATGLRGLMHAGHHPRRREAQRLVGALGHERAADPRVPELDVDRPRARAVRVLGDRAQELRLLDLAADVDVLARPYVDADAHHQARVLRDGSHARTLSRVRIL